MTYPGNTNALTYSYDAMGHLAGMADGVTGTTASASYGTAGEMDSLRYTGEIETFTYNSLWQLTGISASPSISGYTAMNMQYVYAAGQNNGRISQAIDGVSGETVNYTYDSLNRLSGAVATNGNWGQAYGYDGFGNLTAKTVTAGSAMQLSTSYNPATNWQVSGSYDANGNPTSSLTGQTLTYDAENRLLNSSDGSTTYGYDPQGKRVLQKTQGGSLGVFTFYGITGQRLNTFTVAITDIVGANCNNPPYGCVTGPTAGNLYFGGRLLAVTDRLGTVRGPTLGYFPWGEPKASNGSSTGQVFTYIPDMPGQDYADQRYYNSNAGRFYTPDPVGMKAVDPKNPTSWNMYAYVGDDPVNFTDHHGLIEDSDNLEEVDIGGGGGGWGGIGCVGNPFDPTSDVGDPGACGPAIPILPPPVEPVAAMRTYWLDVTQDCYHVPTDGVVTRDITYQLMFSESGMSTPMRTNSGVIWEHLVAVLGSLPLTGANSPSSGPPGTYEDQQSIISVANGNQHFQQTFSVKLDSGLEVGLGVPTLNGNPVLDIYKYAGYISINGNIGGQIDSSGKLVPGSYKPCP
jgi:RHS repeat-associated protein